MHVKLVFPYNSKDIRLLSHIVSLNSIITTCKKMWQSEWWYSHTRSSGLHQTIRKSTSRIYDSIIDGGIFIVAIGNNASYSHSQQTEPILCRKKPHSCALQLLHVLEPVVHGKLLVKSVSARKSEILIYTAWKIIHCPEQPRSGAAQPEKAAICNPDLS